MRQISFKTIEKNLQKKNGELVELRDFRRKLDAKEKEICAEIERLQKRKSKMKTLIFLPAQFYLCLKCCVKISR